MTFFVTELWTRFFWLEGIDRWEKTALLGNIPWWWRRLFPLKRRNIFIRATRHQITEDDNLQDTYVSVTVWELKTLIEPLGSGVWKDVGRHRKKEMEETIQHEIKKRKIGEKEWKKQKWQEAKKTKHEKRRKIKKEFYPFALTFRGHPPPQPVAVFVNDFSGVALRFCADRSVRNTISKTASVPILVMLRDEVLATRSRSPLTTKEESQGVPWMC